VAWRLQFGEAQSSAIRTRDPVSLPGGYFNGWRINLRRRINVWRRVDDRAITFEHGFVSPSTYRAKYRKFRTVVKSSRQGTVVLEELVNLFVYDR
jgi:hypothetical protein